MRRVCRRKNAAMSEFQPVRDSPPVPGWERLAAGLLAAGWVGYFCVGFLGEWSRMIGPYLSVLRNGWQRFLAGPMGDFSVLFSSIPLLEGLLGGLWLGAMVGVPVLILGGLTVASGRCLRDHRRWLWWLALGNGALCGLALLLQSRHFVVLTLIPRQDGSRYLPWHDGWLDYFTGETLPWVGRTYWPFAAEMLLAALVLGIGWWRRKRRGAEAQ